MSDRIKTLEEALRDIHLSASPHPHPLLCPDLLAIKSALALYGDTQTGTAHDDPHAGSQQGSQQRDPSPMHDGSYGNAQLGYARGRCEVRLNSSWTGSPSFANPLHPRTLLAKQTTKSRAKSLT